MMKEVGLDGSGLSGLTSSLGDAATAAPEAEGASESASNGVDPKPVAKPTAPAIAPKATDNPEA